MRARASLWAALFLLACGPGDGDPPPQAEAAGCEAPADAVAWRVEGERRFCASVAEVREPNGLEVRARVRPQGGWKLAAEFPHRLELDGAAGVRRADAGPPPLAVLDLALPRRAAERGRLVFGVCLRDGPCDRVELVFAAPGDPSSRPGVVQ